MNIHEYQAKEILFRHGIKIPRGQVAFDLRDAEAAAQGIGAGPFVVKAQIHAGGRGKAGGIRKAKDPTEVREIARAMFGMRLVTRQSGPQGKPVSRVLVEEALPSPGALSGSDHRPQARESGGDRMLRRRGMEIEEVSAKVSGEDP